MAQWTNGRMENKQGEEQKSGSGKTQANNDCRYTAEAATSYSNKLRMSHANEVSAPLGKQPSSVNSNLSLNAHLCTWWGMAEVERNNNQQVAPSCSIEARWKSRGSLKFSSVPSFTHAFNNISCVLSVLSLAARYVMWAQAIKQLIWGICFMGVQLWHLGHIRLSSKTDHFCLSAAQIWFSETWSTTLTHLQKHLTPIFSSLRCQSYRPILLL